MKSQYTPEQWEEARKWYYGEGCEKLTQKQIAEKMGCKQPLVSQKLGKRRPKVEAPAA